MNTEDIVWKDENLDQNRGIKHTQKEEKATISQIHFHVKDVDDKTVHNNLTYQLTSSSLTKKQYDAFRDFVDTTTSTVIHYLDLVVNM